MEGNRVFIPKTFAVIGAGPSGCVLAAFLAKGGYDVILCDLMNDLIEPALDRGIVVDGQEQILCSVSGISDDIEKLNFEKVDVIFVATKTTALPVLAQSLEKIYRRGIHVVSWQNGIDTERELSRVLGEDNVIRAVVNYGCSLVAPASVHVFFHHPPHYLQSMSFLSRNMAQILAGVMTECGLTTEYTDNIESMIWRKAILNAAMNPVCAVTGLSMYEAMRESRVFDIVDSLLRECISVSEKNNVQLGKDFYDQAVKYMSNAGNHKPSMLMDIENNRKTEIDYINGKFEEYGERVGIKTPYNSTFVSLLKGIEAQF